MVLYNSNVVGFIAVTDEAFNTRFYPVYVRRTESFISIGPSLFPGPSHRVEWFSLFSASSIRWLLSCTFLVSLSGGSRAVFRP
jgi:hypothetical protein